MKDWKKLLEDYLQLSQYPILDNKGNISSEEAQSNVKEKYKSFRIKQDKNFQSDFDKMIDEIKRLEGK